MPFVILGQDPEWYPHHCAICGKDRNDKGTWVQARHEGPDRTRQILICPHCDFMMDLAE